ncbi:ComEA family DNA-binding protein [Qaidamihabitans albus]|uniref:ComEA family DNA-binding protein n=1 Tax=Qaidamihabitans albus TaxID=2795733 RepID=UPI0027DDB49D|nr:ComEA family DNA-binding protein [Qaidamihabitans albus]
MFEQTHRLSTDGEEATEATEATDTGDTAAQQRPHSSRVRLDQLAARLTGQGPGRSGGPSPPPAARGGRLVERWLPAGPGTGVAVRHRRRVAVVAAVLGAVAVAVLAALLLVGDPAHEAPPPLPVAREVPATGTTGPASPTGTDAGPLVVSVVGKVVSPGLVTVPADARVADAVREAGGAVPGADLATINLARRLTDGEQLYVGVPVPPEMRAPGAVPGVAVDPASGPAADAAGAIDLNSAGEQELETLPGIGEVTAQRIVEWRTRHGRFAAVEQLREVDGIGDKRFERVREHVSVR